ncbi:MAG TPA: hypothetical protein VIB07_06850, partial [Nitrososphaera sp.]
MRLLESISTRRIINCSFGSQETAAVLLAGLLVATSIVFSQTIVPAAAIVAEPGIIAFYRGPDFSEEIYVMNSDGSDPTNVSNDPDSDSDPSISPDGTKIAFTRLSDGNYEIYVMNTDGSDQTNISNSPASDYYPNWSPDGSKIAFTRYDSTESTPNEQVWIMDADGDNQLP